MLRKDPFITGNYYHIYNRGIDKRVIFKSHHDFERFMMLLYVANNTGSIRLDDQINKLGKHYHDIMISAKQGDLVAIGSWCLMSNHFHIVLRQEVDGGISKFMSKLGTGYSMYFNRKYERSGSLFGGPFKSKVIMEDEYIMYLFQYVHLNPLDTRQSTDYIDWRTDLKLEAEITPAGKSTLGMYRFSSYLDYLGAHRPENSIIKTDGFHAYYSKEEGCADLLKIFDRP